MTAPLATVDSTRMLDVDQSNELLVHWRIDSLQLGQGEFEVVSDRVAFSDLTVERSRQNLAKSDSYEVPPGTTRVGSRIYDARYATGCGRSVQRFAAVCHGRALVLNVCLDSGFDHPSRFAEMYARHFGELLLEARKRSAS